MNAQGTVSPVHHHHGLSVRRDARQHGLSSRASARHHRPRADVDSQHRVVPGRGRVNAISVGRKIQSVGKRSYRDARAYQVSASIPVGPLPYALDLSPDGTRIYTTTSGNDTVLPIDIRART